MKRKLAIVTLLAVITTSIPIVANASTSIYGKWTFKAGKYYYIQSNNVNLTGWIKQGNNWYYLDDSTGEMITGWKQKDGHYYYLDNVTGKMKTGWICDGGKWYYFGGNGAMTTGWQYINGTWYFLNDSSSTGKALGVMLTGWIREKSGSYYFMDANGSMHIGWIYTGSDWYYLDGNGSMHKGWLDIDGKRYCLNDATGKLNMKSFKRVDATKNPPVIKWYVPDSNGAIS